MPENTPLGGAYCVIAMIVFTFVLGVWYVFVYEEAS
jgi:hypothetical protein